MARGVREDLDVSLQEYRDAVATQRRLAAELEAALGLVERLKRGVERASHLVKVAQERMNMNILS